LRPTRTTERRCEPFANRWQNWRQNLSTEVVRGEIFRLPAPRGARGREQRGARYAVVVQADEFLALSTVLVSPTSASVQPASFRPTITLDGTPTCILIEQTTVVDPQRLGRSAGRLDPHELQSVDEALALVLGL
jgi:mRNA interferase MazF